MSRQLSFHDTLIPPESESERFIRIQRYERSLYQQGVEYIAGVDEAGRGCLAGPVVAAAAILPHEWTVWEVNDSKQLTESKREELFSRIQEQAVSWGVGIIPETVIDQVNILQATYRAMEEAIAVLDTTPQYLLLDAVTLKNVRIPQRGIPKGDSLSI